MELKRTRYYKWTPKMQEELKKLYVDHTRQEIADIMGVSINSVRRMVSLMGLKKSKEALSKIYSRPNSGQFKPGNIPHNSVMSRKMSIRNDHGRLQKFIRLELGKWELLHRYLWKKAGFEIPKGYVLSFKDGNSLNCVLSNLELITMAENLQRNRKDPVVRSETARRTHLFRIDKEAEKAHLQAKKREEKQKKKAADKLRKQALKDAERAKQEVLREEARKKLAAEKERQRLEKMKARERAERLKPDKFRPVDLTGRIPLRIDSKTTVYIRPDQDPNLVIQKYQNRNAL